MDVRPTLPRRSAWLSQSLLCTGLASLPFIFGFFTLVGSWVPPLDDAYIALRTSDVFSAHRVLSGQRSTAYFDAGGMQVHHPGPLENYLLAIPYAVSGFHAWGLLLGDLLVIVGCLWVAITVCIRVWRPIWALLPVSAVWLMFLLGGARLMLRPWNPAFALVPFVALLIVSAALLRGGPRTMSWMPAYALLASVVVQVHLAFVPVVGLLTLVLSGVGMTRWHRQRGSRWPGGLLHNRKDGQNDRWWLRPGVLAAITAAVVWLPPVVEQLMYSPGNFVAMWDYFTAGVTSPQSGASQRLGHVGIWGGFCILSNVAVPSSSFVMSSLGRSGAPPISPFGALVVVVTLGLAIKYAIASCRGRRLRCSQQILLVSGVMLLGCWLVMAAMSSGRSLIYASVYVPATLTAAVALCADALDWLVWRFDWRLPQVGRPAMIGALAVTIVASLGMSLLPGLDPNSAHTNKVERSMIDQVSAGLKAHHIGGRAVRIDPGNNAEYLRERDTLAWGLDEHGIAVNMTFPNWHASSDDDFRVSTRPRPDSVNLTVQYALFGQPTPRVPAKNVMLWKGRMPGYGPLPDAMVVISTASLS